MSDEQVAPAADPAEAAMVELEQRQGDSAFMAKYLNGDKAALAQMTQLHERAYPGAQAAPGEAAPAAPAAETAFSDALAAGGARSSDPMDVAREAAFAPARGAWEYDLQLFGPNQTAEQTAAMMGLQEALYASGMPPYLARTLRAYGERNAQRGGNLGDPEAMIASGTAELERRHGSDAAQIIKDAQQAFALIDERSPAIADALCESGLASDPEAIAALARWHRATARGGA